MARMAEVTIEKIEVHKSESYGFLIGEPGSSAEWDL